MFTHHVSKLLNFLVTTLPKSMPSRSTIRCARSGCDVPEKTFMFGILDCILSTLDFSKLFRTKLLARIGLADRTGITQSTEKCQDRLHDGWMAVVAGQFYFTHNTIYNTTVGSRCVCVCEISWILLVWVKKLCAYWWCWIEFGLGVWLVVLRGIAPCVGVVVRALGLCVGGEMRRRESAKHAITNEWMIERSTCVFCVRTNGLDCKK